MPERDGDVLMMDHIMCEKSVLLLWCSHGALASIRGYLDSFSSPLLQQVR